MINFPDFVAVLAKCSSFLSGEEIELFGAFFFFVVVFEWPHLQYKKFQGQGLDLSHSYDLHHNCDEASSFNPLHQAGDWTRTSSDSSCCNQIS